MPSVVKSRNTISVMRLSAAVAVLLFAAAARPAIAARPVAAVAGVETKSPRGRSLAEMFAGSLEAALRSSGAFDQIDRELLADQLSRYGCDAEPCQIGFARSAGVSLLVRGKLEERAGGLGFRVEAYGIDAPYFGRMLYRYSVDVPAGTTAPGAKELGLICEEHAIRAVAGALSVFRIPVPLSDDGQGVLAVSGSIRVKAGEYDLFRTGPTAPTGHAVRVDERIGKVRIDLRGSVTGAGSAGPRAGDYVLTGLGDDAARTARLHRARKEEAVFQNPGYSDAIMAALFSVPASASMPLMAPLGYYRYGDFEGLCLWAANAAPWLYLEASGLLRRPSELRKDRRDVPRETSARYTFALYMLGIGGVPLFVDAFAHRYLHDASLYGGAQPVVGGEPTAVFLSVVSGGGGHFYKGHRYWGYLYFHLNNALVYSVLREYSYSWRYNAGTDSYRKSREDEGRLRLYLGALGAVKVIEVAHVLLIGHSISAGRVTEERFSVAPELLYDDRGFAPALRISYRF